jgi:probable HAF family extracellular repeat protein
VKVFRLNRLSCAGCLAAAALLGLAACGGAGISATQTVPRLADAGVGPATFSFQTVDDPNGRNNRITGIRRDGKIVGVYGLTRPSYHSFSSSSPGYSRFNPDNYPGAGGTYLTSLSNDKYEAGYVFSPPSTQGNRCGTCGAVHYDRGWILFESPNEGNGKCAVTALLGVNDAEFAVGYYLQRSGNHCIAQAFEAYADASGERYVPLTPPGAVSPVASGINNLAGIVGSATFSNGSSDTVEGWYLANGRYYVFFYPGSIDTQALGVNQSGDVVGTYEDADLTTHGFLLSNPQSKHLKWQTIDAPKSRGLTVVNGISDDGAICGWFKGSDGKLHGFVATRGGATNMPAIQK